MDNQDKIFDKFKKAAQNDELKDFSGMEKVWSRVEDKLDYNTARKSAGIWNTRPPPRHAASPPAALNPQAESRCPGSCRACRARR